jgi:hypothetical protein
MQNLTPSQISAAGVPSPSDVLERVASVAAPPLAPGENEAQYASLAARIVAGARPKDTIEELLTRDVVDLTWEIHRLRKIKSGILKASMNIGVETLLNRLGCCIPTYKDKDSRELSEKWAAGDTAMREEFARALTAAGLSIEEVTATTLERKIDKFEQIERMLASVEARRNNALREIDRHRTACGTAIRQTLDEVRDVKFQDVESGDVTGATQS